MVKTTEESCLTEPYQQVSRLMHQGDTFSDLLTTALIDLRQFLELLRNSSDNSSRQIGNITYGKVTNMLHMTLQMKASIGDPNKDWYEVCVKRECNSKEELESIAGIFSAAAKLKNYHFHYSISQEIPEWIYTDQILLARILLSWLENIDHFSNAHDRIAMQVFIEHNEYLCIKITDTAGGLERLEIEQLFSENRLGTNGRAAYGRGLFLYQKMASSLKGKIQITPTISGLEFYLYLPYQKP